MSIWSVIGGAAGFLAGGPAGAALGASLGGGLDQSSATSNASNTQANATNAATAEQRRVSDRTYTDQAPYRQAGVDALGQFQQLTNTPTSSADVMADPGYAFALQQGQEALDRKSAASGGRISGASLKAASQFNVGTAASGYNAADQRRNDRLNRLASLAGIGQTATNASAAAGINSANQISNLVTGQGNAAAGLQLNQGNIWANTGNQIAAIYGRNSQPSVNQNNNGNGNGGYNYGGSAYNNPSAYMGP
jgi:hypothetical protein